MSVLSDRASQERWARSGSVPSLRFREHDARSAGKLLTMVAGDRDDQAREAVPEEVVSDAKGLFGRRAEGDLAVLVHDSLIDQGDPAADHRLRFHHPGLVIDLRVSVARGGSSVVGTVRPPTALRVELEADTGRTRRGVDVSQGAFAFSEIPHGIVRLHVPASDDLPPIHTDWFRI